MGSGFGLGEIEFEHQEVGQTSLDIHYEQERHRVLCHLRCHESRLSVLGCGNTDFAITINSLIEIGPAAAWGHIPLIVMLYFVVSGWTVLNKNDSPTSKTTLFQTALRAES
ncbi:hypothetical protein Tco_0890869 [Tanacetum coccineum]|uniref:Uncharacterized protein n=1 Tax=Tanacetum coccineum TaxID=301880 RepID=A0ABQ5C3H3_9ASTR